MSRPVLFYSLAAVLSVAALAEAVSEAPTYRDRKNLLLLKTAPDRMVPIRSRADWRRRRQHILLNMQKVMGPLPGSEKRVPLDMRVTGEENAGRYLRRKLTFVSAPGERVPAWLLIPKERAGKAPGVVALHQTTTIGKDEPAGLGGNPDLHYGRELAERGYVVLVPDYPTFGEHAIDVSARGWASGSMKAIWDNMRAIDLLQSLPEVDRNFIGCIGHSLGGHNTLFTAAFDERITAAVSNCGFTAFGKDDLPSWTGPAYMPRIRTEFPTPEKMPFDFHEVVAAVAPRAFLGIAPLKDDDFDADGVREVMAAAAPVYALLQRQERLQARYPDCGHAWPQKMREEAYAWLDRQLRK